MGSQPAVAPSPEFEVVRVAVREPGAFGVLLHQGIPFATTLERTYPLPGGEQHVKIPEGLWTCVRTRYLRGGYSTYEVAKVPGHSRLLFHKGNVEQDSEGCVLVGSGYGVLLSQPAVVQSAAGFAEFMRRAAGIEHFVLRVRNA